MSQDPRALTLQTLSQFLVAHEAAADTLRRIAEIACDAIPAAEIAGMSLLTDDGGPATPIYTHEASPAIDRGQYADGRGPCLDAWRQRRVVNVEDVEAAVETYPAFSRTALDHGVRSTLSLPLVAHDSGLGALNLYSTKRSGFRAVDERVGTEIAAAASVVLANASADARVRRQEEQLAEALQRRALIEQAKGVLMGKIDDLSPDEAFTLLARAAKQQDVTVREVARRVVEERDPTVAHA
jgi:GAF domain-containing protein